MRILLLAATLLTLSFGHAQTTTYTKVTYDFMPLDSTLKWWHRTLVKNVTVTIDSARKQIRIPRLEMQFANCNIQDLIRGIYSTRRDTSLVALDWNDGFTIGNARVLQPGVHFWTLKDSVNAFRVDDQFFIIYPIKNKYVRVIEFSK